MFYISFTPFAKLSLTFFSDLFVLALAKGLQDSTDIKGKVVNAVENGQPLDQTVGQKIQLFLNIFDKIVKSQAKRELVQE